MSDETTAPQDAQPQHSEQAQLSGQPTAPPPAQPTPLPAPAAKPKTDVGFLLLGLFAPIVLSGILLGVMTALSNAASYSEVTAPLYGVASIAINSLTPLLFFGFLAAWMIGRKNGNVRLASFGKGGMWAYAVGALLALLAFGTCVVALSTSGF